ncbi:MAG: biotin--[acetyl-CoA-carboxylase] ligase [Bacteroidota bacterium]
MSEQQIGSEIIVLNSISSTNDYACDLIQRKTATSGMIIRAFMQTEGRGHGTNVWISPSGENLTFSLILFPEKLHASKQFVLTQILCLSILDFLTELAGDQQFRIKWPNDIYSGEKKICGILIENAITGEWITHSVMGAGININTTEFPKTLPNPVSLKLITQQSHRVDQCLDLLIKKMNCRFALIDEEFHKQLDEEYEKNLFRKDALHKFIYQDKEIEATIRGVCEFGQLVLEKKDGSQLICGFKEIEYSIN